MISAYGLPPRDASPRNPWIPTTPVPEPAREITHVPSRNLKVGPLDKNGIVQALVARLDAVRDRLTAIDREKVELTEELATLDRDLHRATHRQRNKASDPASWVDRG